MLPIIELDNPNLDVVAEQVRAACIEYGFFYVGAHGISAELIDDVFAASERFFTTCNEITKRQLHDPRTSRGYTAMEEETLDPDEQKKSGRGDTKEGYYIGRHVSEDDPMYNPTKFRVPNIWPSKEVCPELDNPDQFKNVMENYFDAITAVSKKIVQLIARSLQLQYDYFDQYFTDAMASLRLLHYAAVCSQPTEGLFACGAHSDYGMITVLATDGTPGLQILTKQNEWINIPAIPPQVSNTTDGKGEYYYVVNIGDMLERWTNGLYQSTKHRVVTDGTSERYSIPFFFEPNFDTVVECLPTCYDDTTNPPKYPPITSGEHLVNKYKQTHADFQG